MRRYQGAGVWRKTLVALILGKFGTDGRVVELVGGLVGRVVDLVGLVNQVIEAA